MLLSQHQCYWYKHLRITNLFHSGRTILRQIITPSPANKTRNRNSSNEQIDPKISLFIKFRLETSGDPILVDHQARQSRLNSEALILSNEAVTDGFDPDGGAAMPVEGATDLPDGNSDPNPQPTTPKCFVNPMYEDLPGIPNKK